MSAIVKGLIYSLNPENTKGILASQMRISDIVNYSVIDTTVNRDLSYNRLPQIVKYLKNKNQNLGIYFPSLVYSFRGDLNKCYSEEEKSLYISHSTELVVIDGQHRIKSLEKYLKELSKPGDDELSNYFLTVQIYFGLNKEDEKNLFIDINSNAKKVSMSLITKYDSRDILNVLITDLYSNSNALQTLGVEFNKSRIYRPKNCTFITSKRLKIFISILLFGKKNVGTKEEKLIKEQYIDLLSILTKFFEILGEELPSNPGNVKMYVLGNEAVQNAIAYYLHQNITLYKYSIPWINSWEDEVSALSNIDWTINNKKFKNFLIEQNVGSGSGRKRFFAIGSNYYKELYSLIKEELS